MLNFIILVPQTWDTICHTSYSNFNNLPLCQNCTHILGQALEIAGFFSGLLK